MTPLARKWTLARMRTLLMAVVVLVGSSAAAQSISGTVAATFTGFESGTPQVRVDVNLACSLTCDASAPTKHFAIVAGIQNYYSAAPMETGSYFAFLTTDLDPDGIATAVSTNFKPGSTTFLIAKSVTCLCGGRTGEGGYIDLTTGPIIIPAGLTTISPTKVGSDVYINADVDLRGGEQVELRVEGAGLSQTRLFGLADLTQHYASLVVTPRAVGTVTVTATLKPSNVTSSTTFVVSDQTSSGSGGGGGSSSGTGGGDGTAPMGCSTAGELGLLSALALVFKRRRS